MRPFAILQTTDLLTALAEYTSRFTKMLTEGAKQSDIVNCRETVRALINEMEFRKTLPIPGDPSAMHG